LGPCPPRATPLDMSWCHIHEIDTYCLQTGSLSDCQSSFVVYLKYSNVNWVTAVMLTRPGVPRPRPQNDQGHYPQGCGLGLLMTVYVFLGQYPAPHGGCVYGYWLAGFRGVSVQSHTSFKRWATNILLVPKVALVPMVVGRIYLETNTAAVFTSSSSSSSLVIYSAPVTKLKTRNSSGDEIAKRYFSVYLFNLQLYINSCIINK